MAGAVIDLNTKINDQVKAGDYTYGYQRYENGDRDHAPVTQIKAVLELTIETPLHQTDSRGNSSRRRNPRLNSRRAT